MGERGKASCAWAEKEGTLQNSKILQCARGENWLFAGGAGVEFRVKGVEILAVQVVLGDAQRLAEVSNLSKSHRTLANAGFRGFFCVGKIGETSPHLKNLDVTEVLSGNSI